MTDERSYPRPGVAWFMVAMLTLAYIFSYVDRYVLGLLIQPIKADLGLTDEEIGWLLGPAFAIFYATMGLPLGWLADRKRRTWLIAAGVTVWSLATAASGLCRSFWQLFTARMTVGVGEAVLSPAAFSMISDSFPPERRGKPIAVYQAALTLGAGIASLIGASVLVWARTTPEIEVPVAGLVQPWQLTFFAVGLPGLLIAVGFLFLPEPARRAAAATDPELTGGTFGETLRYVGRRWATFLTFVSLPCVMTTIAYSHGFMPAAFERTYGWPAERFAFYNGVANLIVGPLTVYAMGALSDRWTKLGRGDAPLLIMIAGAVLMVPTGAAAMLMPGPWSALICLWLNTATIAVVTAVGVTALLNIAPGAIRAQLVALYYMAISLSGLLLGPTTVGILSTRVFGEENVRYAVSALPVLYGLLPLLIIPITVRLYRGQMARLVAASS